MAKAAVISALAVFPSHLTGRRVTSAISRSIEV
jgi:hypothetical protein